MIRFALLPLLLLLALPSVARPQDSVLVFNEVHYHPASEGAQTEWLELRSLQGVDVDIGGWRITGGIEFTFPEGRVMPGGGYVVVAAIPGQIPGALGPWTGQLDNGGETIRLVNRNGRVMDELEYSDGDDWPVGPDGGGATLARRTGSAANGATQWAASHAAGGTPAAKNFPEAGDPPTLTTLIALGDSWKYRDNNMAQPGGWTGVAFDDSAWASGGALLYAGSPNVTGAAEGLHGYWPLNESSGTTAANLASGGTVGTLFTGAGWLADGTRGQVLTLDGGDGYVSAGTLPQMTLANNFTWSFWAYSKQTSDSVVLGNRFSPSGADWPAGREFMKFTALTMQFDYNAVQNIDYVDFPTNTWVHHALVKQGASFTYYRNGVNSGSLTIGSPAHANGQPFYFGGDKTNENWSGRLDDIAVWTKALPASSIASLAGGSVTPLTAPTGSSAGMLTTSVAQGPSTHYFRKAFTFAGAKERTTLTLQHVLDDGAVFYLNGTEVARVNLPAGAITHTTPASSDIAGSALSSAITIPTTALVHGANVLAVEVHQHAANNDMAFGATLVASETPAPAQTPSLIFSEISGASDASLFIELQNRSGAAIDLAGWELRTSTGAVLSLTGNVAPGDYQSFTAASLGITLTDGLRLFLHAPGGIAFHDARAVTNRRRGLTSAGLWGYPDDATPDAANVTTISSAIVINEIFYKGLNGSPEQWVELHNKSGAPVDVSGWEFTDGISYEFAAGTPAIAAGGYAVVAWDVAAFQTLHPGVTPFGPFGGALSGKGETITLRDANGNVADQVTYADGGRWSQWADGGGSSLELRDPDADNSRGEAWDASDESAQAPWVTVAAASYQGLGANSNASDPLAYNEFVFGLLNSGEFLIDDISVKNTTLGNVELIQNGAFNGGTAATWRIIGTHSGTVVSDGSGNVLKVTATGATEHMHNHAETTLKNGGSYHTINPAHTYSISFRAKWLRGSNRLHTRLWHNRLPRQTLLPTPATGGTPGMANGRAVPNIGPTFDTLAHTPVVPAVTEAAVVSVAVADPDGLGTVELFTSVNGAAFTNTAMTPAGGGTYTGTIPGQAGGALVQFYVRATDTPGAASFFPAAGAASRAMIAWHDGRAQLTLPSGAKPRNLRIVMPTVDATELYKAENLMSDAVMPCTVILDEREVYYRAGVRLKSSEHGRFNPARCGYTLEFANDELFLGTHDTVAVDRSGGGSAGQREILIRRLSNTAGGIYAAEDDLIRVISPVGATLSGNSFTFTGATLTGAAILSKTRLDREFLEAQWPGGGDTSMHKYERIYVLTQTLNPTTRDKDATIVPENPKVPQDSTSPPGVSVTALGSDQDSAADRKEKYRWYWLLQNARDADDFSGIINVTKAVGQTAGSAPFNTQVAQHIDVSSWLRACVPSTLFGVSDNYLGAGGGQHNALIYFPPDRKAVLMPWDLDASVAGATNASLTAGGDVAKFLDLSNPSPLAPARINRRLYWGHMLDVLNRSFHTSYMTIWAAHYSRFGTEDMTAAVSNYLTPRAAYAMSQITNSTNGVPFIDFARTSASPVTVSTPFATIAGDGWIDVAEIRLQGSAEPLAVTWTDENSWTLELPISAGTNSYTLVAYSSSGTQLGTTSVTVTGTGGVFPAGPGNLIVSELHYNPPGTEDPGEFLELLNITGATLDLSGCHFDEENGQGIIYTFPNGTQVAPGGRIVLTRSQYAGDLDNGGESLVLYAASGLEIFRFSYNDNVAGSDGDGRSMVRIVSSTAPNPHDYTWRASTANGGNAGTSDAISFTGSVLADLDHDSLAALLEYQFGTSTSAFTAPPWTFSQDFSGRWLLTFPRAVNADDATLGIEVVGTLGNTWAPATAVLLSSVPSGNIAIETWQVFPSGGSGTFFVRLKAALR